MLQFQGNTNRCDRIHSIPTESCVKCRFAGVFSVESNRNSTKICHRRMEEEVNDIFIVKYENVNHFSTVFVCSIQDSIVEKRDSFGFSQVDKTSPINSTVSGLSESLKQHFGDGSMDAQSIYKTGRPYFPTSSLHMKLNSRYISKVR